MIFPKIEAEKISTLNAKKIRRFLNASTDLLLVALSLSLRVVSVCMWRARGYRERESSN